MLRKKELDGGFINNLNQFFRRGCAEGITSAAEVRVAFRLGSGKPHAAKLCAYKGMYLCSVISIFSTAVLFIISPYLPGWITPDPVLQTMLFEIIPLIGFAQVIMSIGSASWSIIGAQGRMRLATGIEIVTSWFIAIPIATALIYGFGLNLLASVTALVVSYSVGGVATGYIIITSDWKSLSNAVFDQHATGEIDYEEYYWVDLPDHLQKAAKELGYTKAIWDSEGDAPTSDMDWDELTPSQQEAAKVLGYNQYKWDDEDSDSDSSSDDGLEYDDYDWRELPALVQEAAKVLGYNQKIWDNDGDTALEDKDWAELTRDQQDAAKLLGYTQEIWDEEDGSDSESISEGGKSGEGSTSEIKKDKSVETTSTKSLDLDDMDWDQLPPAAQHAALVLGMDKAMWDADEEPAVSNKYWKDLSQSEQEAARLLGYTEARWNVESDDEE